MALKPVPKRSAIDDCCAGGGAKGLPFGGLMGVGGGGFGTFVLSTLMCFECGAGTSSSSEAASSHESGALSSSVSFLEEEEVGFLVEEGGVRRREERVASTLSSSVIEC